MYFFFFVRAPEFPVGIASIAQVPPDQAMLILQFFELKYPDKNIFHDDAIGGGGWRMQVMGRAMVVCASGRGRLAFASCRESWV